MAGFAKAILVSIIVAVVFIIFSNLMFFFPWYMSVVYETFNLSQEASINNYVSKDYNDMLKKKLETKLAGLDPNYQSESRYKIAVTANRINSDGETLGASSIEDGINSKPYVQRGQQIEVSVTSTYPFIIKIAGQEFKMPVNVTFKLKTTALKYYKDLDTYNAGSLPAIDTGP